MHLLDVSKRPWFDRAQRVEDTPAKKSIALVAGEFHARISEMDDHQLAAIYMAVEQEHVNRMAAAAGYVECEEVVF